MKKLNKYKTLKPFEIHITGTANIVQFLEKHKGEKEDPGWLEIKMLDKEDNVIQTDYMSSITYLAYSFDEARQYASYLALSSMKSFGVDIYRIKVESPPLEEYFDQALYIERHWREERGYTQHPLSYITNKEKYVATERLYDREFFRDFALKHEKTELCLLDTNINHDMKWFEKYDN